MLPTPHGSGEPTHQDIDHPYNQNHQAFQTTDYSQQHMSIPDNGCQCGDSCNCVFCSKHPTNPATRDRIDEIYNIMDQDLLNEANSSISPTSPHDAQMTPGAFGNDPGFPLNPFAFTPGHFAPENGESADNHFQTNGNMYQPDYYYMAYPVSGCQNGYCRCGDNCACVGCQTHMGHMPIA